MTLKTATTAATLAGQFATFRVAGHWFGIAVLDVQEMMLEQHLTPVPLAPGAVAGLINLRGQIVPALEMRQVLGLPARTAPPMNVVLRTGRGTLSLLVD
jgi:purine-binding chemotaxis protein CheW